MENFRNVYNYLFNSGRAKFEVYIHEGEYRQIKDWVLLKPDIETGGDLFGLWQDRHRCVIEFVIGPGKDCHRTTTSFYQDTSYLKHSGDYLSQKHGLCNVGQWHSHHRLNLDYPSQGDERTVWNNMPELGLDAFIVFIATIDDNRKANINCFLFEIDRTGAMLPVVQGEFKFLPGNSPMRLHYEVYQDILKGAESTNKLQFSRDDLETLKQQNVDIDEVDVGGKSGGGLGPFKEIKHENSAHCIEMTPMHMTSRHNRREQRICCDRQPERLLDIALQLRARQSTSQNEIRDSTKNDVRENKPEVVSFSQQNGVVNKHLLPSNKVLAHETCKEIGNFDEGNDSVSNIGKTNENKETLKEPNLKESNSDNKQNETSNEGTTRVEGNDSGSKTTSYPGSEADVGSKIGKTNENETKEPLKDPNLENKNNETSNEGPTTCGENSNLRTGTDGISKDEHLELKTGTKEVSNDEQPEGICAGCATFGTQGVNNDENSELMDNNGNLATSTKANDDSWIIAAIATWNDQNPASDTEEMDTDGPQDLGDGTEAMNID